MERKLVGTSEVLYVLKGHALVDIYDNDHQLIDTRELFVGDLILMVSGGHGFRMLEDTTFLEIKQGPYIGIDEKELF
jgi:cupin superfamily acireductone dioxygenase involved in methionine salvage